MAHIQEGTKRFVSLGPSKMMVIVSVLSDAVVKPNEGIAGINARMNEYIKKFTNKCMDACKNCLNKKLPDKKVHATNEHVIEGQCGQCTGEKGIPCERSNTHSSLVQQQCCWRVYSLGLVR